MTTTRRTTDYPITGDELLHRADLGRCELVKGTIREFPPAVGRTHGRLASQVATRLGGFVEEQDAGEVMVGDVGIYTARDPDSVRAADILFISQERLEQDSQEGFLDVPPELVVEVMSPTNSWEDMRRKLKEYFDVRGTRSGSSSPPIGPYRSTVASTTCRRWRRRTCSGATGRSMGFR